MLDSLNTTPADKPLDYNALTMLKMAVASNGGATTEAYFDSYNLDATGAHTNGDAFVRRNADIRNYDTANFKLFPAVEMGNNDHMNRFNFDISTASEYNDTFGCNAQGQSCTRKKGTDSAAFTQASGYPVQLNHPALPGGVTEAEAIDNSAYGADLMETVPRGSNRIMIDIWDQLLSRPEPR